MTTNEEATPLKASEYDDGVGNPSDEKRLNTRQECILSMLRCVCCSDKAELEFRKNPYAHEFNVQLSYIWFGLCASQPLAYGIIFWTAINIALDSVHLFKFSSNFL